MHQLEKLHRDAPEEIRRALQPFGYYRPDIHSGLILHDIRLDVSLKQESGFHIDGALSSGKGTMKIRGDVSLERPENMNGVMFITGEDFELISTLRLRYTLTPRWLLQTEYGIESGGDVIYTIER